MTSPHPLPSRRTLGAALMIIAAIAWSSGGLFVRLLPQIGGWEIIFWRSAFMALFVLVWLAVRHRGRLLAPLQVVGRAGVIGAAGLAGTFFFYILALTRSPVANVLVIMATAPFLVALLGWIMLGEKVRSLTWLAMAVALAGIGTMVADILTGPGDVLGNLLAFGVPLCFAVTVVAIRGSRQDMVPLVLLAGLMSLPPALIMAWPLQASGPDLAVLAAMGVLQLGLGCVLMTQATRHLTAVEVGLLSLLEPILGPVWVWLFLGEVPAAATLLGGGVVLAALIVNTALVERTTA